MVLFEIWNHLARWNAIDAWIVATGAAASMACALPGCFLLLRRQSMMGDAISHSVLPGIVLALLAGQALHARGWFDERALASSRHAILFAGAAVMGIVCAVASESLRRVGRLDAGAALGVVFTSLFALGLLLMRLVADTIDIDPDCVLYGTLENTVLDRSGPQGIPAAFGINARMLCVNGLVLTMFFKEFRISAFDPALARSVGVSASAMHYLLMALTAVTLVTAFESVGSILVIAMLIVPAATAHLLTDRLPRMIGISLVVAASSALVGHALATAAPGVLFSRLGHPEIQDASTSGMIAVASGLFFLGAALFGPRHGIVSRRLARARLENRMVREDVLGHLFRRKERFPDAAGDSLASIRAALGIRVRTARAAMGRLRRMRWIERAGPDWRLTRLGEESARRLVRSHRLWESYLARNYPSRGALHESAERVEHFIDDDLRNQLARELDSPSRDPHGSVIPSDPEARDEGDTKAVD